jgi:integrase/recombinase XerD
VSFQRADASPARQPPALRELRFGRDNAELTTKKYADGIALFLQWCHVTGRDCREAAPDTGLVMTWLKYVPAGGGPLAQGPGARPVRGEGQVNNVMIATRGPFSAKIC